MKKFSFSLDKLLGYKTNLLDNEKLKLRTMQLNLRKLEGELLVAKNEYRLCINNLAQKMQIGISANEMFVHNNYINEVEKLIKQINRRIFVAKNDIEMQTNVVINITKETKSLEKLEEKQLIEYKKECGREEEKYIEEFVSNTSSSALVLSPNVN